MTVLSIGELLWDVFPDQSHLGGAPFNFAASCARLGHNALFLSAVGHDDWGARAFAGVSAAAVSTEFIQRTNQSPTGMVHVKFDQKTVRMMIAGLVFQHVPGGDQIQPGVAFEKEPGGIGLLFLVQYGRDARHGQ